MDEAIIEFVESGTSSTNLVIGPDVARMTEREILDMYNDVVRAQEKAIAEYEHVAVEIPPGSPQIRYSARGDQWVPRGDVLRCYVTGSSTDDDAVIEIDDQDLTLRDFGRLLDTYAGWGMRICFVPEDDLEHEPEIEVREPDDY